MQPLDKPPVSAHPLTLLPGHWDWTGQIFVWSPPRWVDSPAGGSVLWLPGSWSLTPGGCVWNPGRFIPATR